MGCFWLPFMLLGVIMYRLKVLCCFSVEYHSFHMMWYTMWFRRFFSVFSESAANHDRNRVNHVRNLTVSPVVRIGRDVFVPSQVEILRNHASMLWPCSCFPAQPTS